MAFVMTFFFILLAAVIANLIVQVVSYRHWRGSQYFLSIISGFAAGLVVFALLEIAVLWKEPSSDQIFMALFVDAPTYAALAYCYYNFVQLGQSSVRIRLYTEISACTDGLAVEEVARQYADDALVRVRLQRLVESGDVRQVDDRYFAGRRRLVAISKMMFLAKRLLLGKSSEFEKMR
jgi:hypothetical protein